MDKSRSTDRQELRMRSRKAFALGAVFLVVVCGAFLLVQHGPDADNIHVLLRRAFRVNEKVWTPISSRTRLSIAKPKPPAGKEPRVNGDLGLDSEIDPINYTFEVDSGDRKLHIGVPEVRALPRSGYSTDFRCIEGWSEVMQYAGLRFSDFMDIFKVGRKPDGTLYRYVGLETPDRGYYVSIDMDSMLHPQTLLAYELNEHPLSMDNGAPIRLVIPIKYGIKSLKRIGRIFFSDQRPPDYWAEQGYDWFSGL